MGYKKISKDLKRKILKEVEETKEVTSVAKKYGVDPSSIFKWKKYGIEAKRREYTKEFRKQVVKEKVVKKLHVQGLSQRGSSNRASGTGSIMRPKFFQGRIPKSGPIFFA